MSATSKQAIPAAVEPPERAADRPPAVLHDPTTSAGRDDAPCSDDHSHTPPHGDALLPHGLA